MASALDDLLADFTSHSGEMPKVNPPEASTVLESQTAPEVAGEPEPPEQDEAPPAPTEKPAEVRAAEAAKTRKPRQSKPKADAPAAPPDGWNNLPAASNPVAHAAPYVASTADLSLLDLLEQLQLRLPGGITVTVMKP